MRNLIAALMLVIVTSGCNNTTPKALIGYEKDQLIGNNKELYDIVVIDGCQYIYRQNNGYQQGPIFTHKGNCNNPIHKTK